MREDATGTDESPAPAAYGLRKTIARLYGLLRAQPGAMAASIILGLLAALFGLAWHLGVYHLIVEALAPTPDVERMSWTLATIAALLVTGRLAFLCSTALSHRIAFDAQRSLRLRIAKQIARVPLAVVERYGSKSLRRLIIDDVERVEDGLAHLVPETTANFVAPVLALIILFAVDWRLALATAGPVLIGIVAIRAMSRGSADLTHDYYESSAAMSAQAADYVAGLPTLRLFDHTDHILTRFRTVSDRYLAVIATWVRRVLSTNALLQVFVTSGLLFVLPLGLWLLAQGSLNLDSLVLFVVLAPSLGGLFTKLPNFAFRFAQQGEVLARLDALLTEDPLVQGDKREAPDDRTVRFEGVTFRRGEREALSAIDLVLEHGTVTALVGASGAGKSTLANLLLRHYDPHAGRVTIGGVDLKKMAPELLNRIVGTVPQQPWLFSGTFAENLRIAAPGAEDAELEAALRAARADALVASRPGGLSHPVAREGGNLSGGERQRLAIARTILRDPPILVLDEATAAADPVNEREIQRGLGALARGRTVLVIAHRLASIVDADRIVVLEAGRVVESGTHASLMRLDGRYARFWALQHDGEPSMEEVKADVAAG